MPADPCHPSRPNGAGRPTQLASLEFANGGEEANEVGPLLRAPCAYKDRNGQRVSAWVTLYPTAEAAARAGRLFRESSRLQGADSGKAGIDRKTAADGAKQAAAGAATASETGFIRDSRGLNETDPANAARHVAARFENQPKAERLGQTAPPKANRLDDPGRGSKTNSFSRKADEPANRAAPLAPPAALHAVGAAQAAQRIQATHSAKVGEQVSSSGDTAQGRPDCPTTTADGEAPGAPKEWAEAAPIDAAKSAEKKAFSRSSRARARSGPDPTPAIESHRRRPDPAKVALGAEPESIGRKLEQKFQSIDELGLCSGSAADGADSAGPSGDASRQTAPRKPQPDSVSDLQTRSLSCREPTHEATQLVDEIEKSAAGCRTCPEGSASGSLKPEQGAVSAPALNLNESETLGGGPKPAVENPSRERKAVDANAASTLGARQQSLLDSGKAPADSDVGSAGFNPAPDSARDSDPNSNRNSDSAAAAAPLGPSQPNPVSAQTTQDGLTRIPIEASERIPPSPSTARIDDEPTKRAENGSPLDRAHAPQAGEKNGLAAQDGNGAPMPEGALPSAAIVMEEPIDRKKKKGKEKRKGSKRSKLLGNKKSVGADGRLENKPNDGHDPTEMSVLGHLRELRQRTAKAVLGMLLCFVALFPFADKLYTLLAAPLIARLPEGSSMIATQVVSPVLVPIMVTFLAAFALSLPHTFYQVWAFVAPGLYKREKCVVLPVLLSAGALFALGVAFCYWAVFPVVFRVVAAFTPEGVRMATDISSYVAFAVRMFFCFGLAFEVPVAVALLAVAGGVSVPGLKAARPYVIVGAFVVAAIVTPPDVASQFMLAAPLIALYELGVIAAKMLRSRKEKKSAGAAP